jgi:hypothetical protein
LLFMIKHNFVNCFIFLFVSHYGYLPVGFAMCGFAVPLCAMQSSMPSSPVLALSATVHRHL